MRGTSVTWSPPYPIQPYLLYWGLFIILSCIDIAGLWVASVKLQHRRYFSAADKFQAVGLGELKSGLRLREWKGIDKVYCTPLIM
jgi:hypothetical protein